MKGKKLTLEEVLKLEYGVKVWVEEFEDYKPRLFDPRNYLCEKKCDRLSELNTNLCTMLFRLDGTENRLYYEWIEDLSKTSDVTIEEPYYSHSVVVAMADEIANLRYPSKYEYDGELIESIIEELFDN